MSKGQKIIGYLIEIDELRLLLDMPHAGREALEDALRKRLAHSGSADVVLRIITHDGGS